MAKKLKKFAVGGDTDYDPEQDIADAQAARDAGSFGAAFRAAQKDAGDTFMWRGKRFKKDMAKPKAAAPAPQAPMDEVTISAKRGKPSLLDRDEDTLPRVQRKGESAEDYMDPTGEKRRLLAERGRNTANKVAGIFGAGPAAAGLTGMAAGAAAEGLGGGLSAVRNAQYWRDKAPIGELIRSGRFGGYKKGGKVKKYEAGGVADYRKSSKAPGTPPKRPDPNSSSNDLPPKSTFDSMDKLRAEGKLKKGGKIKKYAKGGGIESKGKTRGRMR